MLQKYAFLGMVLWSLGSIAAVSAASPGDAPNVAVLAGYGPIGGACLYLLWRQRESEMNHAEERKEVWRVIDEFRAEMMHGRVDALSSNAAVAASAASAAATASALLTQIRTILEERGR